MISILESLFIIYFLLVVVHYYIKDDNSRFIIYFLLSPKLDFLTYEGWRKLG